MKSQKITFTIYKARNNLFLKLFSLRKLLSTQGIAVGHEWCNLYAESPKQPDMSSCGVFMIEASIYPMLFFTFNYLYGHSLPFANITKNHFNFTECKAFGTRKTSGL